MRKLTNWIFPSYIILRHLSSQDASLLLAINQRLKGTSLRNTNKDEDNKIFEMDIVPLQPKTLLILPLKEIHNEKKTFEEFIY